MRHLIGIFLAILMAGVLAAAVWGYLRLAAVAAHLSRMPNGGGSVLSDQSARTALLAVAGAGLLAGILIAAPRVSPLASAVPGLILIGVTAVYVLSTRHVVDLLPLPSGVSGTGLGTMVYGGIAGAAGLVMTVPVFIPSRWRTRDSAAAAAAAGAGEVTAGAQDDADTPEPAQPAGHARLVSAAPVATGALPSRAPAGPRPSRSAWPGSAGGAAGDSQTGRRPWPGSAGPGGSGPGSPGQGRPGSGGVRLSSPWRLPES
ncbi:MAG: hypothetical protein ACM32E_06235 [Gemmatimonadota bacterium]